MKINSFKLNNPLISLQEKAYFLKTYVSKHTKIHFDALNNTIRLDIDNKYATSVNDKLLNRVGDYIKSGNISLGAMKLDGLTKNEASDMLRSLINNINVRFDMYVRSNKHIINRIEQNIEQGKTVFDQYNNQEYTTQEIQSEWKLHGYQEDFIKLCRKRLLWINAFATGLGKTATALSVVSDQHNLNLKKKTLFVVPKSTLSNWYREACVGEYKNGAQVKPAIYTKEKQDKCFFVNLVDSNSYKKALDQDMFGDSVGLANSLADGNKMPHLLLSVPEQLKQLQQTDGVECVFMSTEDFYRLKLKPETIEQYINYQKHVDVDFANMEMAEGKQYEKRVAEIYKTLSPNKDEIFFEDFNFDSIVIDEEHIFKNAKTVQQNVPVKYLSIPPVSNRGLDILAKTHYIRKQNKNHDGVLGLTATPITNSPLEVYSMLAIVLGEFFINKLLNIAGVKDFITLFCIIENEQDFSVDGELKNFNVFKGFNNLQLLKDLLSGSIYFLKTKDVRSDLKLPDEKEIVSDIQVSDYQKNKIIEYKTAYNVAKELVRIRNTALQLDDGKMLGEFKSLMSNDKVIGSMTPVMERFHEEMDIIASPFNFIRKMENLILDEDMNERATVVFINKTKHAQVQKAINQFNKKKFKQKGFRLNPHTNEDDIIKVTIDEEDENKKVFEFYSKAKFVHDEQIESYKQKENHFFTRLTELDTDKRFEKSNISKTIKKYFASKLDKYESVVIDTLSYDEQTCFFDLLQENGVTDEDLYFNISNKMEEFLVRFVYEQLYPRGKKHDGESSYIVKQLVFCDYLGQHYKIRHLVSLFGGIDKEKIVVVTGQTNNDNETVQDIQNGFNEEDESNLYQVVVGNKKIEVGINLQNGTQAIHHLTIGWTPDSEIQRNGRGVRQGNQTDYLNIYHYGAVNTFDNYKRSLVNVKDNWIDKITDFKSDANVAHITEMLSKEQQEKMIELLGESDDSLVEKYQEQIKKVNIVKLKRDTREKQDVFLNFILNSHSGNPKLSLKTFHVEQLIDTLTTKQKTVKQIKTKYKVDPQTDFNTIEDAPLRKLLRSVTLIDKHLEELSELLSQYDIDFDTIKIKVGQTPYETFVTNAYEFIDADTPKQVEARSYVLYRNLIDSLYIPDSGALYEQSLHVDEIENNLMQSAIDGYRSITEGNEFAYYPLSIIDNPKKCFKLNNEIVIPKSYIWCAEKEYGQIEDMLLDIQDIVDNVDKSKNMENSSAIKAQMLLKYMNENGLYLNSYKGELEGLKQYPSDRRMIKPHAFKAFTVYHNHSYVVNNSNAEHENMKALVEMGIKTNTTVRGKKINLENFEVRVCYENNDDWKLARDVAILLEQHYFAKAVKKDSVATYDVLNNKGNSDYLPLRDFDYFDADSPYVDEMKTMVDELNQSVGVLMGKKEQVTLLNQYGHAYLDNALMVLTWEKSNGYVQGMKLDYKSMAKYLKEDVFFYSDTAVLDKTNPIYENMEDIFKGEIPNWINRQYVVRAKFVKHLLTVLSHSDLDDLVVLDLQKKVVVCD